jgi:hypothetical protein
MHMTLVARRALLVLLLLVALSLGPWAYVMPRSWYDTFPGFGMHWIPQSGPYNEHFVKDIGGMYLGLAALTAVALWLAARDAVVLAAALAWTVFNALHLLYHLTMLQVYDTLDRIFVVASLVIALAFSAALLIPARRRDSAAAPPGR